MKNNEYEYFTYEIDSVGIIDVYGWTRHTDGPLKGHPRKMLMGISNDLRDVLSTYPGIYDTHPAFD